MHNAYKSNDVVGAGTTLNCDPSTVQTGSHVTATIYTVGAGAVSFTSGWALLGEDDNKGGTGQHALVYRKDAAALSNVIENVASSSTRETLRLKSLRSSAS